MRTSWPSSERFDLLKHGSHVLNLSLSSSSCQTQTNAIGHALDVARSHRIPVKVGGWRNGETLKKPHSTRRTSRPSSHPTPSISFSPTPSLLPGLWIASSER